MNKINVQDIDFSSLKKMKYQGSKSTMYGDDEICYKFLDGLYPDEIDCLYKKLIQMDGIKIDSVYLPRDLILQDDKLVGFTFDNFKDSMPIYDKFNSRFVDFNELFNYITKACIILREIHKNDIVCQDLSFDNILVDNNGNVAFCDMDSCCYGDYVSPFISMPMKKLIYDYRKEEVIVSKNFDRISMLVSFYYLLYKKYLYRISRRDFELLSENVETIDRTMIYVKTLLDRHQKIPDIPYLDELIVSTDNYVMDRQKDFSLLKRILKK